MERLREKAAAFGIKLSDHQLEQFETYYEMLVEKNKVMNLTAITEKNEVIDKHFADSLALIKGGVSLTGQKILDIGTGAGFPGVPIKIAFPETDVCLLDSLNKRVNFLNEVIHQLGIKKVDAIHSRAEDGARNPLYREKYRIGVSRAVANLATLSEYVLPFVEPGGYFIAYKSGEIDEELEASKKAIGVLGGEIKHVYKFSLPGTDFGRSFVFIKKNRITPKKYPRKSGLPSKEPIK